MGTRSTLCLAEVFGTQYDLQASEGIQAAIVGFCALLQCAVDAIANVFKQDRGHGNNIGNLLFVSTTGLESGRGLVLHSTALVVFLGDNLAECGVRVTPALAP
jgi:hypothetical protein